VGTTKDTGAFEAFFERIEPLLRRALVATYGVDRGREAASEALAYAWQHWAKVQKVSNPVGFLYRVGQSKSRPRRVPINFVRAECTDHPYEPGLASALAALSESQRVSVVLVHAYG
jgi:DNA-directed RNA polymerase specialized sigma24 family protein